MVGLRFDTGVRWQPEPAACRFSHPAEALGGNMASILEYRPAARDDGSRRNDGAPCEIILFPGVRYERWEAAPVKAKARRRAKVKRDHLEIPD